MEIREIPAFDCVALDHHGEGQSDSTEMGQQHHWGMEIPPWLQVRGSGWPGSGALAGGGGGGRICRKHTVSAPEASLGDIPSIPSTLQIKQDKLE